MRFKWQMKFPGENYKLYIYLSGTPTPAKVYLSETATDPVQTPPQVTTGSDGKAEFWIDDSDYRDDQRFDIKVIDPYYRLFTVFERVDIVKSIAHGIIADVGFPTLQDAINFAVQNNRSLLITKVWDITEDFECNTDLVIAKGGGFDVADGVALTLNGGIQSGLYQVFYGNGTVAGNPKIKAVYPEWFGAKGDGEHDDANAIQKALNLGNTVLSEATYKIGSDLIIPKKGKLKGTSLKTILNYVGNGSCIKNDSNNNADQFIIENLTIQGTNNGQNGIYIKNHDRNSYVKNVYVIGFSNGNGVYLEGAVGEGTYFVHFINCLFENNKIGAKIYTSDESGLRVNVNSFSGCSFIFNLEDGIYVNYGMVDFFGCEFENNGSSGVGYDVNLGNCYVNIIGGHIENNERLLNITNDTRGLIAFNSVSDLGGGTEIYLNGVKATKNDFRSLTNLKFILPQNTGPSWPSGWLGIISFYEIHKRGESADIFKISHTGGISWGDGNNDPDCVLYRKSYQQMRLEAALSFSVKSVSDGDATPSVKGSNVFVVNNSSATSITTFDDGEPGQKITVIFKDSNTTIVHGSGIYLKGGTDVTPSANTTMEFVYDGSYWYEV